MQPSQPDTAGTVHNFAEWYRSDSRKQQLPVDFVKDLMRMEEIVQTPPGTDPGTLYKAVLSVVEQIDDPMIFGLGVCWLDGKGYGDKPMQEVLRLRGGTPPSYAR